MTFFRKSVIGEPRQPLLIRYALFRCAAWGIYVHHLLRPDHQQALHDHPWPFISIVLRGSYVEVHDQTETGGLGVIYRGRGSVALRPAQWRHRVRLPCGPAWTLVIVGRRERRWGFFTPAGWCWWRNYNSDLGICEDRILHADGED